MTYVTKAGIKVVAYGKGVIASDGVARLTCYRIKSGAYHGVLRRDRLTPYRKGMKVKP